MIFGKDQEKFDFNSFKGDVNEAAEPLIASVVKYSPNKKKRRYQSNTDELPETAGLFFKAAADTLDQKSSKASSRASSKADSSSDEKDNDQSISDRVDDLKLDKKAQKAGQSVKDARKQAGKQANRLFSSAGDSAGKAGDAIGSTVKDFKLDKKLASAGKTFKDVKLDKKLGNAVDSVKDARLDKKVGSVVDTVVETVKDARLDKKFGSVVDTVSDTVKDAGLDKKLATVGDNIVPVAATVVSAGGALAANVADNVGSFIKDNKLDKKAANLVESAGEALSNAADRAGEAFKDAKLDQKLSDAGKTASKTLSKAQLPEKAFEAANIIPGVTIKNPKKAAKQFRKTRAQALKAAGKQQKELGKLLAARQKDAGKLLAAKQKDAGKFIKARQKDIASGKLQIPFVEPKKKKGFPWKRVIGGAGLGFGGLAANNARIWNSVAPLESKLNGESRYYRSRQGIIFYKEAGQGGDDTTPVVFVHGIGAGNSSYEFSENFDAVSQQFQTYAFDLLGFGNSDRPKVKYTAEFYIKQLTEFLDEVVKKPAYIIASSLGAAYAVQVAYRRPELIKKLVLSSPTGINKSGGKRNLQMLPGFTYSVLRSPVIGKAIYSGVSSKTSIRSFMQNQMFYDKSKITDEMIQQYFTSAHQQGAEYAPPSFFTGLLDAEIGHTLGKLNKPVLMFFGKESLITPLWEANALKQQNPSAEMVTLDQARLSVNWEQAEEFNRRTLEFLGQPDHEIENGSLKPSDLSGVGLGQSDSLQNQAGVTDEHATGNKVEQAAIKLSNDFVEMANDDHQKADVFLEQQTGSSEATRPVEFGSGNQANTGAETMEAATEYEGSRDLQKELQEHRETFIGDADSGAALVEDGDNNGVDDRRMGNNS